MNNQLRSLFAILCLTGEYGLVPITRLADVQANSKSIAAPPVWDFGIYVEGKPKN